MAKTMVGLNMKQIQTTIKQLGMPEKMKIFETLEKETRKERWKNLFNRIEKRYKKNPVSDEEILRICKEVRKKRYERTLEGCR